MKVHYSYIADFVARNADFQSLVQRLAVTANQSFGTGPVASDALLDAPSVGGTRVLREFLTDAITSIRENIVRLKITSSMISLLRLYQITPLS